MNFRDLKQGYTIFLFDRKEVALRRGVVKAVSLPHFDAMHGAGMVVDVTIYTDGKDMQYVLQDASDIGFAGDLAISADRESVLREVERVKRQAEDAIKMEEYNHGALEKCSTIIEDLSPEAKQKAESDRRMDSLEEKMNAILVMLKEQKGGAL